MPLSTRDRRTASQSRQQAEVIEGRSAALKVVQKSKKRTATVYDAVAGRVGPNGFLTARQFISPNTLPSLPEEVLLRRVNAPDEIPYGFYEEDQKLDADQKLPDSDLLKAVHAYASDYFAATSREQAQRDFRSFDGTALLAMGILLEEAAIDALGQTGDMALVEPEGLEDGLPESKITRHQIRGRVKPRVVRHVQPTDGDGGDTDAEQGPRKRRKAGA